MALIVSAASGNFNAGATWVGGVVPTVGDEARASTGHTITITANANCDLISNLGTGNFVISNGVTLTANITSGSSTANSYVLRFLEASPAISYVVGNVVYASINSASGINNSGTGTLTLTGNVSPGGNGSNAFGVNNTSSGVILITGNCTGATWTNSLCVNNNSIGSITIIGNVLGGNNTASPGVTNATTGPVTIVGNVSAGTVSPGLLNNSTGTITLTGELTASTAAHAVTSTNASSVVRVSGSLIYASNGLVPVNTTKFILLTTPTTAKTRYALNGVGTFVDMFTADNTGLGPATNHVRSGVTYLGMTGTLAVPLPSQVAVGVATDNTVGTAVLTGADIATAVWGAGTRTLTAGAGISASDVWSHASRTLTTSSGPTAVEIRQELDSNSTKLANLDATVSSRLAPSGTLATVTTLTNAPASVTPAQIRAEMDANSTKLANLDATVSSRLATSGYTAPSSAPSVADIRTELAVELGRLDASVSSRLASASYTAPTTPPTAAQIATAVEGSLLNEADGQAVLNALVSAIGNTNLSEVSLVAAVRADLERNGGKLDNIPTTSAPSASAVAGAVRTELGVELGRLDASVSSRLSPSGTLATVTNLTNAPASVTPSDIWSHASRTLTTSSGPTAVEIRQEIDANSTKLDAAISSRMAASEATKLDAVKAKTDALNTERLGNVATTNIVGTLLAQANS